MSMSKYLGWFDYAACTVPIVSPVPKTTPEIVTDDEPAISTSRDGDTLTINLTVNDVSPVDRNIDMYNLLLQKMKEYKILKLTELTGRFRVFVDMAFYDANKNVIEQGIKIHDIGSTDVVKLFDIPADNSAEYVVCKKFSLHMPYSFPIAKSGVNMSRVPIRYIRIRNIAIYAEVKSENTNEVSRISQTLFDRTINPISPTIEQAREDMVEIFNSTGTNFGIIKCTKEPRTIDLSLKVVKGGFIWINNLTQILNLIEKNIQDNDLNGNGIPDVNENDDPTDDVPVHPGGHSGGKDSDDNYFEAWERCVEGDPHAHVVVKDLDYDETADNPPQVKYSEVVIDIPDIAIGEFVHYEKFIIMTEF